MAELNEQFYTPRQAAKILKLNEQTICKLASEEKIPAFKLGDRWKIEKNFVDTWQYTAEDISKFLNMSQTMVYKLAKQNNISAKKIKGSWRFQKPDYESLKQNFTQNLAKEEE